MNLWHSLGSNALSGRMWWFRNKRLSFWTKFRPRSRKYDKDRAWCK